LHGNENFASASDAVALREMFQDRASSPRFGGEALRAGHSAPPPRSGGGALIAGHRPSRQAILTNKSQICYYLKYSKQLLPILTSAHSSHRRYSPHRHAALTNLFFAGLRANQTLKEVQTPIFGA